jgi:Protein of unknown function (DUF3987)
VRHDQLVSVREEEISAFLSACSPLLGAGPQGAPNGQRPSLAGFPQLVPITTPNELAAGVERSKAAPVDLNTVAPECGFIREALTSGGKDYANPLWHLTTLITTFCEDGRTQAHLMGNKHPGYSLNSTDELFDRKAREKAGKDIGWPQCKTISASGATQCQSCPHYPEGKSPLNFGARPPLEPRVEPNDPSGSFADPWSDFVGPEFPVAALPATLAAFVNAEHQAMGADRSALAMAAITTISGAMHAETRVEIGDGWSEPPIIWTALVGQPSAMKSPIITKATTPLHSLDHYRDTAWRKSHALWEQAKAAGQKPGPVAPKPGRDVVQDATPEKLAEILSRGPAGSLMVHDELAGWLGGFERYSSGASSRAFFLQCWNGGVFLKDRVGQGTRDPNSEIRVDNLALCVLGGIQPDRLAAIRDLTGDGLLQRFLPVLMRSAKRGDESTKVSAEEANYDKLIKLINKAWPRRYHFAADAIEVRKRVLDRIHTLEQLEGFPPALIGAIGKLKGYYARLALVLHVAAEYDAIAGGSYPLPAAPISRRIAEDTERVLFKFLLPHIFGLYDSVTSGGQDRDAVRMVAAFIIATNKERLRPSDFTAGVRALRGSPQNKISEWASRFCAMGWLVPENPNLTAPTAWVVVPGLHQHFAARRAEVQAARAAAHEILRAGGTRK